MSEDLDKITTIVGIACLMIFLMAVNKGCLQQDRKAPYYLGEEIKHKADSLMNTWKENELKRDTL